MNEAVPAPQWRRMRASDIAQVVAVANIVHLDFFEDEAVFRDRFERYPGGCYALTAGGKLVGYAISHPWVLDAVPALNSTLPELPQDAHAYYIHDIALLPSVRFGGMASHAVKLMSAQAERDGFSIIALVAVNGSQGFWEKKGFVVRDVPVLAAKLKTYSNDALYMVRVG